MTIRKKIKRLLPDNRGAALVEFALLAPVLFGMMLGVMYIGLQMMSYNALQAISSDIARYTVVEYQKLGAATASQTVNTTGIRNKAIAIAVNPPYDLEADDLTVVVTHPSSDIGNTDKYTATITYTPYNPIAFLGVGDPTMREVRSFYVAH